MGPWYTQPLETLISGEAMIPTFTTASKAASSSAAPCVSATRWTNSDTHRRLRRYCAGSASKGRWPGGACRPARAALWNGRRHGTSVIMLYTNAGYGEATALPSSTEDFTEVIDGISIPREGLNKRIPALVERRARLSDVDYLLG